MELVRFEGNCPRNVSKDAKYSVQYDSGKHVIGIVYRSTEGEKWYPVSGDHPELVEMVNNVKKFRPLVHRGAPSMSMNISRS